MKNVIRLIVTYETMKTMYEKIASCVLVLMLSGCFVIRSTKSEWKTSEEEITSGGIGDRDMSFLR